jgi:hypothetical protein
MRCAIDTIDLKIREIIEDPIFLSFQIYRKFKEMLKRLSLLLICKLN